MAFPSARVLSYGFFAPGFPTAEALLEGVADVGVTEPPAALLTGRTRRYTSLVTRLAAEVAGQALAAAGVGAADVRSVFGAGRGESQTALALLDLRERTGGSSAARFTQSVHSTPSGVFSLATGNRALSTTLAAGDHTFAMAWLETFGLLAEAPGPVLVVVADEPVPPLLSGTPEDTPAAVAFVVEGGGAELGRRGLAELRGLEHGEVPARPSGLATAPRLSCPAGAGLPLLEAVARRRSGRVPLERGGERVWSLEVMAPEEKR